MFDEPYGESWRLRFGTEVDAALPALSTFLAHRCVRRYRPDPIPDSLIQALVGSAQSAATSSNLQLYTMISVQDSVRRESIAKLCADQSQVREAGWFFAFCADHFRLRQAALEAGQTPDGLDYTEFFVMALIDAALAAERMVCAAEAMGLGVCYIGALRNDPVGVAELLDLPVGVFGAFGLCLGWPADDAEAEVKPRLKAEAIWHRESYRRQAPFAEYDVRMAAFYESQGMKGDVTWSMRSGRRVDGSPRSLSGRDVLKGWLAETGFGRR